MKWLQRAVFVLLLAAISGFAEEPVLANMFSMTGLLMLDLVLLFSLVRLLGRLRSR